MVIELLTPLVRQQLPLVQVLLQVSIERLRTRTSTDTDTNGMHFRC